MATRTKTVRVPGRTVSVPSRVVRGVRIPGGTVRVPARTVKVTIRTR